MYTNDIHGLYVLQLLEFHWNTTYIGTMLPGWWTHQRILHIIWIHGNYHLSLITRMVMKGIGISLHLSLHVYAMIVIEITCCVPWITCFETPMGCTKRIHWKTPSLNMYTNCIHKVFPSLNKYGVYNFSPLIVLCTCTQLCAMHLHSIDFAASYRTYTMWTHQLSE